MRFRVVFLLIAVFFSKGVFATVKTDSLENLLTKARPKHRVQLLNELSHAYRTINLYTSLERAQQALKEAKEVDDKAGQAYALKNIGIVYYFQGKNKEALGAYNKSLFLSQVKNLDKNIGALYNNMAIIYHAQGKIDSALIYYNLSKDIHKEYGLEQSYANNINNIGRIYFNRGEYEKAYQLYVECLNTSEKLNDWEGIGVGHNNLGNLFHRWGDLEKALEHSHKAIEVFEKTDNKMEKARSLRLLGGIYLSLEQQKEAVKYFKEAYALEEELADKQGVIFTLSSLGRAYISIGDYKEALNVFLKSYERLKNFKDIDRNLYALTSIGGVYVKLEDYDKAIAYLDSARKLSTEHKVYDYNAKIYVELANAYAGKQDYFRAVKQLDLAMPIIEKSGDKIILRSAYKSYADIYKSLGIYRKALEYKEKEKYLIEELFDERTEDTYNKLKILMDIREMENKIETLSKTEEINKVKIKYQRYILYFIVCLLVLLLVVSRTIYIRYKFKRKNEKVLEEEIQKRTEELKKAKDQAEESSRLKTAFLHNISHEIRTPLNAITGFSNILADPSVPDKEKNKILIEIEENTNEFMELVDNVIILSAFQSGKITLKKDKFELEDLINQVEEKFRNISGRKKIDFIVKNHIEEAIIKTDREKIFKVIVNLLDNSFKFTEKGFVKLAFLNKKSDLEITVVDSGKGIPKEIKEKVFECFSKYSEDNNTLVKGAGLGLTVVNYLVDHIGGKVLLVSEIEQGAMFVVTLKDALVKFKG